MGSYRSRLPHRCDNRSGFADLATDAIGVFTAVRYGNSVTVAAGSRNAGATVLVSNHLQRSRSGSAAAVIAGAAVGHDWSPGTIAAYEVATTTGSQVGA